MFCAQLIRTLLVCTWNFDVCSTVHFAGHVFCYTFEDSLVHMDRVSNVQGPMIVIFSSNLQNKQKYDDTNAQRKKNKKCFFILEFLLNSLGIPTFILCESAIILQSFLKVTVG